MDVEFTNSWYDVNAEQSAAKKLIQGGAILISQHADSMGAPGLNKSKKFSSIMRYKMGVCLWTRM